MRLTISGWSRTRNPTRQNVAWTWYCFSRSRIRGVLTGSGPSSNVSATASVPVLRSEPTGPSPVMSARLGVGLGLGGGGGGGLIGIANDFAAELPQAVETARIASTAKHSAATVRRMGRQLRKGSETKPPDHTPTRLSTLPA